MASEATDPSKLDSKSRADKLKRWGTKGLAGALGVLTLAACGPGASADHVPTTPATPTAATATQHPGASEAPTSTAAPTAPGATESQETAPTVEKLVKASEVFQSLSAEEKAQVSKNIGLSFPEFDQLETPDRATAALVLADAFKGPYIEALSTVVPAGSINLGHPLGATPNPQTGNIDNLPKIMYERAVTSSPDKVTPSDNVWPYFLNKFIESEAGFTAASGNPAYFQAAKLMFDGSQGFSLASGHSNPNHSDIAGGIEKLDGYFAAKEFDEPSLGFPLDSTDANIITGTKADPNVSVHLTKWDDATGQYVPGSTDGITGATYGYKKVTTIDGKEYGIWIRYGFNTNEGNSIISGWRPNTLKTNQ